MSEPADPDETEPRPPPDAASGTAARRARQQARRAADDERRARAAGQAAGSQPSSAGREPSRRQLDPDVLAAMEEERSFLLRSLDDLEREHDAGDVDDVDYEVLKDDYTARAAAVIRAIDERHAAFERSATPRRRSRTIAWVAALLVASIGIGVFVAQSSGRREAGESVSGDIRLTTRDQLLAAQSAFGEGRFTDAIDIYDDVLEAQPANTEALTYKGWLLYQTSTQVDVAADQQLLLRQAKALLDQAVEIDGGYADARVFRATVSRDLGEHAAGIADLDAVPDGAIPVFMATRIDGLRAELEAGLARAPGTTALP